MAKCHYCQEKATERCGICRVPVCDEHKYATNRWHNPYHARWMCKSCYEQKEKKRKVVLVPVVLLFFFFIAKSMDVKWGFFEPSTWLYFFALSCVLLGVSGAATVYNLMYRTKKRKLWVMRSLAVFIVWLILYFVSNHIFG